MRCFKLGGLFEGREVKIWTYPELVADVEEKFLQHNTKKTSKKRILITAKLCEMRVVCIENLREEANENVFIMTSQGRVCECLDM